MDRKTLIRMGYEKYESEKIHHEIFEKSTEHQYYSLGVAQGMYFLYKTLNQYKDRKFTGEELMDVIKSSVTTNGGVKEYFERLLLDIYV